HRYDQYGGRPSEGHERRPPAGTDLASLRPLALHRHAGSGQLSVDRLPIGNTRPAVYDRVRKAGTRVERDRETADAGNPADAVADGSLGRAAQPSRAGLSAAEDVGRRPVSADQYAAHDPRWDRVRILKTPLLVLISVAAFSAAGAPVTFDKQIAPIIYNNCSSCHRPGEAAPFSLLSYQDVAKRAKLIASVTSSRYMPPWKAEPGSYAFKDERRLKDSEIALIGEWVKEGMPEGNPKDAPAPPKFASGWMLG